MTLWWQDGKPHPMLGKKRPECGAKIKELIKQGRLPQIGRKGSDSPRWKGGRQLDNRGYWLVRKRDHPFCNSNGRIQEHRLMMEQHIGRYLYPWEVVHHVNHVKTDNRIENLFLTNATIHPRLHKS
jgi:HNH endonuclease